MFGPEIEMLRFSLEKKGGRRRRRGGGKSRRRKTRRRRKEEKKESEGEKAHQFAIAHLKLCVVVWSTERSKEKIN